MINGIKRGVRCKNNGDYKRQRKEYVKDETGCTTVGMMISEMEQPCADAVCCVPAAHPTGWNTKMPTTSTIPLHPLLERLYEATEQLNQATKRCGDASGSADNSWNWLLGDRWTPRIEGAIEKPTELEAIRVEYDEAVVNYYYQSELCADAHNRRGDLRTGMYELLREAIAFHATLDHKSPYYRLKTLVEAAIVDGASAETTEPKYKYLRESRHDRNLNRRFYIILVQVYRTFLDELKRVEAAKKYPTEPAVPGKKYQSHLNADVDLRRLHPVAFKDCVNDLHPHSARLATVLKEMDATLAAATAILEHVKAGKGEVNERQHQSRLIEVLHGTSGSTTANNVIAVEAQNARRVKFETARQVAFVTLENLAGQRDQVFDTLKLATEEAEPLIALTMQDNEIVTVDKWRTAPVIMLNCLAADLRLRKVTRALETMREAINDDITGGIARRMIGEVFAKMTPRYRNEPYKPTGACDFFDGNS